MISNVLIGPFNAIRVGLFPPSGKETRHWLQRESSWTKTRVARPAANRRERTNGVCGATDPGRRLRRKLAYRHSLAARVFRVRGRRGRIGRERADAGPGSRAPARARRRL